MFRAGSPSWWAENFRVCAARFMAPRVRGRIKTPVAAAVSAARGTWMGPQASTIVSCLQLCGEYDSQGPSDDDILESVNPLKLSSVECNLQSLLCPERGKVS